MDDLRCQCGKIVAQSNGNTVIIKCRHCKRYMLIKVGPGDVELGEHTSLPHFQNRQRVAQHACAKH